MRVHTVFACAHIVVMCVCVIRGGFLINMDPNLFSRNVLISVCQHSGFIIYRVIICVHIVLVCDVPTCGFVGFHI